MKSYAFCQLLEILKQSRTVSEIRLFLDALDELQEDITNEYNVILRTFAKGKLEREFIRVNRS